MASQGEVQSVGMSRRAGKQGPDDVVNDITEAKGLAEKGSPVGVGYGRC